MAVGDIYDIGDAIESFVTFSDADDNVVDPDTVTFSLKFPDATTVDYVYGADAEVVRDAAGSYHADLTLTQSGRHYYQWIGTGVGQSMSEGWFSVQRSSFL